MLHIMLCVCFYQPSQDFLKVKNQYLQRRTNGMYDGKYTDPEKNMWNRNWTNA